MVSAEQIAQWAVVWHLFPLIIHQILSTQAFALGKLNINWNSGLFFMIFDYFGFHHKREHKRPVKIHLHFVFSETTNKLKPRKIILYYFLSQFVDRWKIYVKCDINILYVSMFAANMAAVGASKKKPERHIEI